MWKMIIWTLSENWWLLMIEMNKGQGTLSMDDQLDELGRIAETAKKLNCNERPYKIEIQDAWRIYKSNIG